jgi:pimeloyl-ACP methyl ester carboxylesterase
VLLLHGQPGSARDWERVLEALGPEVEAIALERPGWDSGRTHPTGLAGNGDAAVAALDARGIERVVVVGHSFGGAVAAWLAARRPERVAGLVLAAPAANTASLTWVDEALAAPVLGPVMSGVMLAGAAELLGSRRGRRLAAARSGLEEAYLRSLAAMLRAPWCRRSFLVEQRALVDELPALEPELGRIAAPTVIVEGAGDRVVPVAAARALARQIDGAELLLLPRAGHLLPHQHAGRLADLIATVGAGAGRSPARGSDTVWRPVLR